MPPNPPPQWAELLLAELRRIDRETAPHGLYGLRHAHQTDASVLPSLSRILVRRPFDLVRTIGGTSPDAHPTLEGIRFRLGSHEIHLTVRAEATTKIRKFGNRYVLDPRTEVSHLKQAELAKQVAQLGKSAARAPNWDRHQRALLSLGHFTSQAEAEAHLSDALAPKLLDRWKLRHLGEIWEDLHQRKFWSSLHIWSVRRSASAWD